MKKILSISSFLAILVGIIMLLGSVWGIIFTYKNIKQENIITPPDASIPNTPVRGPFTLHSQASIIRQHVLEITGGKTYSQMPQKIQQVDDSGNLVFDDGVPVLISNDARTIWITATALTTALNLGIITYAFSGFVALFGLISICTGIVLYMFARNLRDIQI